MNRLIDRLTYEGDFCDILMCTDRLCRHSDDSCLQRQLWERLKEYEDAEEQGKMIMLPCSVGDNVWVILNDNKVHYGIVTSFVIGENLKSEFCIINEHNDASSFTTFRAPSEFGKTFFLAREEAECKVAQLEAEAAAPVIRGEWEEYHYGTTLDPDCV